MPCKGEGLDRAVGAGFAAVDHPLGEEALDAQVMHREVGVIGRRVAGGALRLAEEERLAAQFGLAGFARIELPVDPEFRRRREVEHGLEFSHRMDLAAALPWTWLPRSSGLMPFFAAITGSPSK